MKRTARKLRVPRETLRSLVGAELVQVGAGFDGTHLAACTVEAALAASVDPCLG